MKKNKELLKKLSKEEFIVKMNEKEEINTKFAVKNQISFDWKQLGIKNEVKRIIRW